MIYEYQADELINIYDALDFISFNGKPVRVEIVLWMSK